MHTFWLTFNERAPGCVEANSEAEAVDVAKQITGFSATSVKTLPYPANPRINAYVDPKYGICPPFCFKPNECCGKTACPQRYSCTE